MRRLEDKVAIVAGAGSIAEGWSNGRATAVLFACEGAKVFAVDQNLDATEHIDVELASLDDVLTMLRDGRMSSLSSTAIGYAALDYLGALTNASSR